MYIDRAHLLRRGVLDSADQMANVVSHGFGGDTSSSSFEIDMAAPTNAERIALAGGGEQIGHIAAHVERSAWIINF